ncbi:hypothetical protein QSV38_02315 [Streptococcus parasuis]|uniref:hypothetical protein n=1 Tax=Streptococcus parasuis TaxID=1501662 RepID=UPI0025A5B016|nr:hypothetical protein [Streptococcus parasuis]WJQ86117.1 hypothetical protein QSV38_02315 [Streptococcus parasuis]
MKGIKVIDIGSNPEETQFGTCELCFRYGVADNPYMVLEFPDGTQVTHNTYDWDCGDYWESNVVDNVVDFSAWLIEQELSDEQVKDLKSDGKHALIRLIEEYNWQLEEADE